ncbi:MAG: DUF485 domain-containing protein [Verrucomicrobiota bacterium]
MLHEPAPRENETDHASAAKARLGVWMFGVYCVLYAGFVLINAIKPELMAGPGLFGVNLAITYGMVLIVVAIVLGLIYNAICNRMEDRMNAKSGDEVSQ